MLNLIGKNYGRSKEVIHNDKAPWLDTLTLSLRRPVSYRNQSIDFQSKPVDWFLYDIGLQYCTNVQQTQCTFNEETFGKVVNKMQDGKSPGNDLIVGYWYKHLTFYRHALIHLFDQTLNGQQQLPA